MSKYTQNLTNLSHQVTRSFLSECATRESSM